MVGQHHQFNGHELGGTPGAGEGQGGLACHKESDMTQRQTTTHTVMMTAPTDIALNNTSLKELRLQICFRQFNSLVHRDGPVATAYDIRCISI